MKDSWLVFHEPTVVYNEKTKTTHVNTYKNYKESSFGGIYYISDNNKGVRKTRTHESDKPVFYFTVKGVLDKTRLSGFVYDAEKKLYRSVCELISGDLLFVESNRLSTLMMEAFNLLLEKELR